MTQPTASESRSQGVDLAEWKPPESAAPLGMFLFLSALTMFFAAALIGYWVVRRRSGLPPPGLPLWFWFSTFALLLASLGLYWSLLLAKAGRGRAARRALRGSGALGTVFVGLQVPGLIALAGAYAHAAGREAGLFGLVLALIVIHAIHVIGGLVRLAAIAFRSGAEPQPRPLRLAGWYWHYLGVVWLVMFNTMLLA